MNKQINLFIALGLVALTAGVSGGVVWYYQKQNLEATSAELQTQINQLSERLEAKEEKKEDEQKPEETGPVIPQGWKIYQNTKWKYSFAYPTAAKLSTEGLGAEGPDSKSWNAGVLFGKIKDRIYGNAIDREVFDIRELTHAGETSSKLKTLSSKGDLAGYAKEYHRANKANEGGSKNCLPNNISALSKTIFVSKEAYQFKISKCIGWSAGGWILDEETQVVIVKHNDVLYLILYPTGNNSVSLSIIKSFSWL